MSSKLAFRTFSNETILKRRGYKLLSKLGEGSYAKVYLGEFQTTSESTQQSLKLACKLIDTRKGPKEFVKKFLPRELNVLIKLNHPHIIHIHSIFQIHQKYYIFMRYAEQGDLLDFILKNGIINEDQTRVWFRQIVLAVQYLHELNIAHRDLKCENILVTINYNVKLSDFGFARYVIDPKRRAVMSETYCGSLSYVAPEVLHGRPYNPKYCDIWSVGVVLFVMLNKAMPFDDHNAKMLLENQTKKNWKFRSKVENFLSTEVKSLVTMLLDPDPLKRYTLEQILNNVWIGMDVRLRAMTTYEFTALATALESRSLPPENIMLPKIRTQAGPTRNSKLVLPTPDTATTTITPPAVDVVTIKEYDNKQDHRISTNNKVILPLKLNIENVPEPLVDKVTNVDIK